MNTFLMRVSVLLLFVGALILCSAPVLAQGEAMNDAEFEIFIQQFFPEGVNLEDATDDQILQALCSLAVSAAPEFAGQSVTRALQHRPDMAATCVTLAITAAPDQMPDITAAATAAAPDQVSEIIAAVAAAAPAAAGPPAPFAPLAAVAPPEAPPAREETPASPTVP